MASTKAELDALVKERAANNKIADAAWQEYLQKVKDVAVEIQKSNAKKTAIEASKSTISETEYLQKQIEVKNANIDISDRAFTDIANIYNKIAVTSGSPRGDYVSDYQAAMKKQLTGLQVVIADAKYDITALETKLNALTGKQSAAEEEAAKAKAAEDATKPPPPANANDASKASPVVADDEKNSSSGDNAAGLKTNQITSSDVSKTTTAAANKNASKPYAQNDDEARNGVPILISGATITNSTDQPTFKRTYNPLTKIPDYTYNLTLRLAIPELFNRYVAGDTAAINEAPLIIRSGGSSGKKAAGFELDCYIDELEIKSLISTQATASSSGNVTFKFKIFEPYGFSVPTKLAALQKNQGVGLDGFRGTFFLTVKFYGWGNTAYGDAGSQNTPPELYERTFCIYISKVTFKLDRGLVVYDITAIQAQTNIGFGNRGELSINKTIQGATVGDLLVGNSSSKDIISLVNVLNDQEKEKVTNGKVEVANIYKIEIIDDEILEAKIVLGEVWTKGKSPFAPIDNSKQVNAKLSYANDFTFSKKNIRQIVIPAGTTILKAIDNIIAQSSYIRNSLPETVKEDQLTEDDAEPSKNAKKNELSWYNITPLVKYIPGGSLPYGKDAKRMDFAYEITYVVQKYKIPFLRSAFATNQQPYYGPYKKYDYWYTGHNTEVLSFDLNYDFAYNIDVAMNSQVPVSNTSGNVPISSKQPNADNSGKNEGTNEEVNSIRSWLYSPGDFVNWNLTILGDPDYLMPSHNGTILDTMKDWYGPDLVINPGQGQVYIEIDFKQAQDYNTTKGLLQPDNNIKFMDYPISMNPQPKGFVFHLHVVMSTFNKGRFEQKLKGGLPNFHTSTSRTATDSGRISSGPESANQANSPYASQRTQQNTQVASTNVEPVQTATATSPPVQTSTSTPNNGYPRVVAFNQGNNSTSSAPQQDTSTALSPDDDQLSPIKPPLANNDGGGRGELINNTAVLDTGLAGMADGARNIISA